MIQIDINAKNMLLSPNKIKLSPKILESTYLSIDIDLATNINYYVNI